MVTADGYKETELGPIPASWAVISLGEIGESLIGLTYNPEDVRAGGILVLRASNIRNGQLCFDDNVFVKKAVPRRIMVRPGDVLVCVRNGSRDLIGKAAIIDERDVGMTFGAFMAVFRSQHGALINYLLQSNIVKRQINEQLGATINQITNRSLNSFRVPFPDTQDERHAIVSALSDVDALLKRLGQLLAKKRDLKKAAMQQLLTGHTRLPGFGDAWHMKSLETLGNWRGGMTPSMARPEFWERGTIPWISSGDVKTGILSGTARSTTAAAVQTGAAVLVPANSIIVVTRSGILRKHLPVAITNAEMAINQDIKALTPARAYDPMFLLHAMTASGPRILATCMKSGTTVESVDFRWLRSFEIELPQGIEEQRAIATVLSEMNAEIVAIEAQREKVNDLKQAIMQELLTGKTRLIARELAHA